jgi:hypothetical protein
MVGFGNIKREFRVREGGKTKQWGAGSGAWFWVLYGWYVSRPTSSAPNLGVNFFKLASTSQVGAVQVPHYGVLERTVTEKCGSLDVASGPRYVLSYGQAPLFGALERSDDADPTQILGVLSAMPPFASTLISIYTSGMDVLLGFRNEIGSPRTTRRPENRLPPRDRTYAGKYL